MAVAALVLGCAALWLGGEWFVMGASRIAEAIRVPTILVGMVVAGFGTSTPELAVSLDAVRRGDTQLALGNVLGSNVANVLLVLAVAAIATPVGGSGFAGHVIAGIAATALLVGFAANGVVGSLGGGLLLAFFALAMTWLIVREMRSRDRTRLEAEIEELVGYRRGQVALEMLRTLAGLALVLIGADRLVWAASVLARQLGVSETAIGLTIVAVGTSLPEVVTSAVAARRGEGDLALGNVLGSNLFNAALIAGVAAVVGGIAIPAGSVRLIALGWAMATSVALTAFARPGFRLRRRGAVLLLAAYVVYVVTLYAA
jgi:cation:H+ antiporter